MSDLFNILNKIKNSINDKEIEDKVTICRKKTKLHILCNKIINDINFINNCEQPPIIIYLIQTIILQVNNIIKSIYEKTNFKDLNIEGDNIKIFKIILETIIKIKPLIIKKNLQYADILVFCIKSIKKSIIINPYTLEQILYNILPNDINDYEKYEVKILINYECNYNE